jgi:uncharacterized membrane protein YdbT with pleckstrin-like domain
MKEKRKYVLKVRRSRKAYLPLYLMVISLLILIGYLYYSGNPLDPIGLIVSGVFVLLTIKFTEVHRITDWWAITDNSLVQSLGLLNRNVREVGFSSISDFDLDQPFFKRILDYGNVNVRLFINETSIKINDINRPAEFIEELQKRISLNQEQKNGIR